MPVAVPRPVVLPSPEAILPAKRPRSRSTTSPPRSTRHRADS
jgi:hypothetical protein